MRILLFLILLLAPALAQDTGYRKPPKALADLVAVPATSALYTNPSGQQVLIGSRAALLTLKDLAEPELKLAGLRFNPSLRAQSRRGYLTGFQLQDVATGKVRPVTGLPKDPRMQVAWTTTGALAWSPDATRLVFSHDDQLWLLEVATARAHRIPGVQLHASFPTAPVRWLDNSTLVCRLAPNGANPAPTPPPVPPAPIVQEHQGGKAAVRTFPDLLQNAYDARLFEHAMTCDLALVDPATGKVQPLARGMFIDEDGSPDGRYLLVDSLHLPFSYNVQVDRFPILTRVLDRAGKSVKTVADLPLAEQISTDSDACRPGPRHIHWRSDKPATLVWAEAQDNGDPRQPATVRDKVFALNAPFTGAPTELASLGMRYDKIYWGDDGLALVKESWWKTRKTRTWQIAPGTGSAPVVLFERSSEDRYSDPGDPVTMRLPNGQAVLRQGTGGTIFLAGDGASPEGNRPFLDRYTLATKQAQRLWRSQAPYFEHVARLLDDGQTFLTSRETNTEPPNVVLHDLKSGRELVITHQTNAAPQLAGVSKELIRYKRADGVDLTATLYLPPGYTKDQGPLPVLMWAYPAEFKSAAAASQVVGSPYRFVNPWWSGPLFFVLRGYAVLDNPTFPIIGEGTREPNDTYVEQLLMGAQAAVDEVARRGVGDPNRCAIGGHSYGAFTTANLLAHSDLFRAGIARSGAYNRTLTPFGFQSEDRTYWEAPEIYTKMAPFTVADKIDEPLLLIHGAEDNNPGTFPIQSERLYAALKGLGKPVRLVMLPKESHGYQARESVLHVLWEMDNWLEQHVKNAGPRVPKTN